MRFFSSGLSKEQQNEINEQLHGMLDRRDSNNKKFSKSSNSSSTNTNTNTTDSDTKKTFIQKVYNWKFTIISIVCVVIIVLVLVFVVFIPNKKKEDDEKAKKKIEDDAKAKAEAEKKEKDKVFSKLSTTEIKEQEKIDYNYKKSRVILFEKVDYNNPIDDTFNKINYKINTEKSLTTDVTVSSNSGINSIRISNCKVNLKNAKGDSIEYKHFMIEPDNWFKTNLLEKYHVAKITIMSEIILYDSDGKIIDSGLNKIDITDINRKDLPNIQFSGFKIRNCKIFLYPDKNFTGKEEIFNHSSKNDNVNEPDDSKCFLYKSFGKTIFKSIKIEAFR
jgi:hypothetical protein